ncbi:MAG: biotin synthase BioB [Bacteroidales bacterium]|nr:biotin synthase BioB [Bacteroidales bacterium]MBD5386914.1 biotin synthase BioB [bacterium]
MTIDSLKDKVISGEAITIEEALWLASQSDREKLFDAAGEITRHYGRPVFNPCSIINARAGRCSENCKWCAQSGHYHTDSDVHGIIDIPEALEGALMAESRGIKRYSLVTSGRSVKGEALKKVCAIYRELEEKTGLFLCTSLGLLEKDELQQVWDAGVRRYHCNLETAPSYFPQLCSTHTIEDKIRTIRFAREIGFQICSGGIIGMGETREQRVEFAFTLRSIEPDSIPINILCPIPGTPLENTPPISEEEILLTVAIFRFVNPRAELRFAGGRQRLSPEVQKTAMRIGVNGAIIGDLLTTIGSKVDEDRRMIKEVGYEIG